MNAQLPKKYFSKRRAELATIPNLVSAQLDSFKWLLERGLYDLFSDFSPIQDYAEKDLELEFVDYSIDEEPKHDDPELPGWQPRHRAQRYARVLHREELFNAQECALGHRRGRRELRL